MSLTFEVLHTSKKSGARVGRLHTPHGVIDTPNYVPVATNGTLKAVDNVMLSQHACQLMFCNTYHLALHPGADVVEAAGGLHQFINRDAPIITDSGGFQVFSLAYGSVANELKSRGTKQSQNAVLSISEDGVKFRSYRDGSPFTLTPERSVNLQKQLGADIIIPFDELPPYHCDYEALVASLDRTHRWQDRSLTTHLANPNNQSMYAVVHGGTDTDLRIKSCNFLANKAFDGMAIGGSLGKNLNDLTSILHTIHPHLPPERPRHLLGIADVPSILACLQYGMDTFDSCYPTRAARHGILFNQYERIKITSSRYKSDFRPIDETCDCWTCKNYTRAYLHHLFKAKEPSALTLATIHNVAQMFAIMADLRKKIAQDII